LVPTDWMGRTVPRGIIGAISRNHYSCLWSDICIPCRLLKRKHDSDGARALQKKQIPGNLELCHCPELLLSFGFETSIEDAQSLSNHDQHQNAGIEWFFNDSSQYRPTTQDRGRRPVHKRHLSRWKPSDWSMAPKKPGRRSDLRPRRNCP
jgi:hypothetical protein